MYDNWVRVVYFLFSISRDLIYLNSRTELPHDVYLSANYSIAIVEMIELKCRRSAWHLSLISALSNQNWLNWLTVFAYTKYAWLLVKNNYENL